MRRDHELAHRVWLAIFVAVAILTAALMIICTITGEPIN